jgi:hypothetical protein
MVENRLFLFPIEDGKVVERCFIYLHV